MTVELTLTFNLDWGCFGDFFYALQVRNPWKMKEVYEADYFKDSTHSQAFHLLSFLPSTASPRKNIKTNIFFEC